MVNSDNSGFSINFNAAERNVRRSGPGVPKKTHKNFEEVMRKEERDEKGRQAEDAFVKEDKGEVKKKDAFDVHLEGDVAVSSQKSSDSIFDVQKEDVAVKPFSEDLERESLSALFKGLGTKEKLEALQMQVNEEGPVNSSTVVVPKFTKDLKANTSTEFMRETPDLAMVNPLMAPESVHATTPTNVQSTAPTRAAEIQEIVDQIIAKLYTLKVDGKTDTTISLKHPPMFAGANLVVTAFDSAKGEFNITFENLTQAAKQMLELAQNEGALKNALQEKGFVVHILTATTTTVEPRHFEGEPLAQQERGEKEGQQEEENEREG